MTNWIARAAVVSALVVGSTAACASQEPLEVGARAPAFSLTGASRDGVLPAPVELADLRDKTVVIAFFYRARTKG